MDWVDHAQVLIWAFCTGFSFAGVVFFVWGYYCGLREK